MPSVRPRSASQAPAPPRAGTVIAGKYRVEGVIGEGGMGTVLVARHEILDIRVAVKVLSAELSHQPNLVARFLQEARAVARLKSEHVARVMDVGTLGDNQPYIVMELLEGEDLERRLQRGPLSITDAADFILQTLEAMAHAHGIGIVHRDLKPANLFATVATDGREMIKVLDFGIAKLTGNVGRADGSRSGAVTAEHNALGSPSYMAPEQVRASREVDRRADIWALGAILYELLTAKTAFGGETLGEIFGAVLHSTPAPLRGLRPGVPEGLEEVIARCLQRAPEDRFADVAELARAIAPFGSGMWSGHLARIEQMCARAASLFDPEATSTARLRLADLIGAEGEAALLGSDSRQQPGSSPSSARSRLQAPRSPRDEDGRLDTLPAPSGRIPRRRIRVGVVLAAALLVAGGVGAALFHRSAAERERAMAVPLSPTAPTAAAVPPRSPLETPSVPAPPSAVASPPAAPSPSSGSGSVAKPLPPPRAPQVRRPGARQGTSGLPNVLRSSD
ncbi:MAG: serine/threonine-protein kinase [Polyangiaceae bacterium]